MTKLSLAALQQQMIGYLMDDEQQITEQIAEQGGIDCAARLHIYQNAYQMRLKETIENDHQQLGIYLGDDLFDQMVAGYIKAYPSNNTSLRHYADLLPKFLAENLPFKNYPIISELAHFERLLMIAFDAADTERFSREILLNMPHEQWPSLVFRFHPSVQLAHFNFSTVETWQALKQEQAPEAPVAQKNIWLLWRNHERLTQFRSLDLQEFTLIDMVLKGNSFADLCEYLLVSSNEEDISQLALNYLLSWIDEGLFANR